jgi:transcriptional regulator with XRE-family HTH domain
MRQNGNYSVISVALFVISCRRIRSSLLWQIPISFQLSALTEIHGFIAFLPLVPVRLKYLKSKVVLPAPTTLGEHIRQRRLKLQLTLKEAAKLLGTDECSVINWEKGRTVPKVYRLPAIIRFLGYNPLPEPRTISERLVAKRLERGWPRKLGARHLGIDVSTLRDWEQGKIILFRKHQTLVASFLSIPEGELGQQMKTRWKNAHGQTNAS